MGDEFYAIIKLVSGEEILSLSKNEPSEVLFLASLNGARLNTVT